MKKIITRITAILTCIAMLAFCVACKKGSKPDADKDADSTPDATSQPYSCTVTVDASNAYNFEGLDAAIKEKLSNEGILLNKARMSGFTQHTAAQVSKNACSLSGIIIDIENGTYGSFIKGIGGLHNGDCGEDSYWLLKVNGKFPEVGADSIIVKDGDDIMWVFTCDGGADVGYSGFAE